MTYQKTRLKSGLRLITIPMKGTETVTVLVLVEAGSSYETKSINGISHFLEHMMFKGTLRRPSTLAISEELDSIGGEYNAFTSKEWTGYYAKADYRQLPLLLDIISDIYLNSKLDAEEIEREKMVILEEMNMYQDTPIKHIDDLAEELLYGDQPQGWKVIGEVKTIKAVTAEKMYQYYNGRYTAKNTVLILAGNLSKIRNLHSYSASAIASAGRLEIENYFADITEQGKIVKRRVKEVQTKPQFKLHYKKTDQSHIAINLRAYHTKHKDLPALKLLNIILGGNMSSRLFINIREREGLCYYINSSVEAYQNCGYLGIKAGVDNKRIDKAIKLILKQLCLLKESGVAASELQKAKAYVRGKLALTLETSDDLAFWVGAQEVFRRRIKTPAQILAEFSKVKHSDVNGVAQEVIQNRKLNMVIIGPYSKGKKFLDLLSL